MRSKIEIIHAMLDIIVKHDNAIKRTPLLRYANVSSQSFKEYYQELQEKGLIQEEEKKGKISVAVTEKGFRYLEKFQEVRRFVKEFEL